jgi:hypothetical protein
LHENILSTISTLAVFDDVNGPLLSTDYGLSKYELKNASKVATVKLQGKVQFVKIVEVAGK